MQNLLEKIDALEQRFNQTEPRILAFVPEAGRFNRLRTDALRLLDQYHAEGTRPPLFGVLLGVKDMFHVAGFDTRAGSRLPSEVLRGPEAVPVSTLKAAGALIVGKTNTTEFAYFSPGPTRNPHNAAHTPGGSSSGSAAGVAAGLCELALGTQTIGSVSRPAAYCGVVGFKPTYDRISIEGVIPLAGSLDHVGLFAREVRGVLQGAAILVKGWRPPVNLGKPVLGIPAGPYLERAEPEGLAHFQQVVDHLKGKGLAIQEIKVMADFDEIFERHYLLTAAEAARVHRAWFAEYAPLYAAKTAELIRRGAGIPEDELARARAAQLAFRKKLGAQMAENAVDLWLSPAAPGAAPRGLETTGSPVMNLPWTQAGLPTLTLLAGGNAAGLPLGLQLTGGWWQDELLLAWGLEIENLLAELNPPEERR